MDRLNPEATRLSELRDLERSKAFAKKNNTPYQRNLRGAALTMGVRPDDILANNKTYKSIREMANFRDGESLPKGVELRTATQKNRLLLDSSAPKKASRPFLDRNAPRFFADDTFIEQPKSLTQLQQSLTVSQPIGDREISAEEFARKFSGKSSAPDFDPYQSSDIFYEPESTKAAKAVNVEPIAKTSVEMNPRQSTGAIFQVEPKSLSELQKQRAKLDTYNPDAKPIQAVKEFKPVPKLSLDESAAMLGMKPNEYKGFQENVYAETKFLESKPYQEASERIVQQQFKQQQTYFDALKAWNKAGDPSVPMPRKEDFAQPMKRTFDMQATLSEASMRAKKATTSGFGKTQPKSSNFIAESALEAAAKSTGATTQQVKAQIANQRASGLAPDLNKATEAISVQQSQPSPTRTEVNPFDDPARRTAAFDLTNRAFKQNISTSSTRSLKELQQTTRSPQQFTFNPPMAEPVASTRAKTPSWELPAADFVPLPIPNKVDPRLATAQRVGDRLTQVATTPYTGNVGRIGGTLIKGFDYGSDITQAAQTFSESVNRGETGSTAVARATASVGSAYGVAAITNALPLPAPVKLALTVGGSLAAAYGADKAIDSMVGRNEAKETKYAKDLSKLNLAGDPDSEMLQPFGKAGDRDYLRAYGNSLVNVATLNMSTAAPELGRSLANLTNSQAIANARLASERDTSIQAGMDAKSNRSIAYEDLGEGKSRAFLRDRGYTSTESRVLALQNLANESGYETPRTGKFDSKTLDALEKLGYSQGQISKYIQGETKEIGKPRQIEKAGLAVRQVMNRSTEKVTGQQLSQALAAERKAQGLKGGEMLNQGQVDRVFSSLAGRSLTQLRQSTKVGGNKTQSALRLGAGIK
jgi:hypothetical protein